MSDTASPEPVGPVESVVRVSARAYERDRYLAALLAPPSRRSDLLAIAAFAGEVARVPAYVSEPMMGEIRLQWWRDALELEPAKRSGHPIADAVRLTAARHHLPPGLLLGVIDAHTSELGDEPLADEQALKTHLAKTQGTLFELALSVLGPRDALAQAAAASAGQAYGLARMLLEVPALWAQGRTLLPASELAAAGVMLSEFQEGLPPQRLQPIFAALAARARVHLAEVRRLAREIRREQHVALLPTALVEPYLQALEKPGRDLLRDSSDIAPLSRTWRLLRAHWSKRL